MRKDKIHVICYTNLFITNLFQLSASFTWMAGLDCSYCGIMYLYGGIAGLNFRMCSALERYPFVFKFVCAWIFLSIIEYSEGSLWLEVYCYVLHCVFIMFPQLGCIRKNTCFLLYLLIRVLFIFTIPLTIAFQQSVVIFIYALLPAPVFIFSIAKTLKALPGLLTRCWHACAAAARTTLLPMLVMMAAQRDKLLKTEMKKRSHDGKDGDKSERVVYGNAILYSRNVQLISHRGTL